MVNKTVFVSRTSYQIDAKEPSKGWLSKTLFMYIKHKKPMVSEPKAVT